MTCHYKILPFPNKKSFAVTFVDDTDLSTRANTEPVYEFLDQLNIRGTKTVWVTRPKRNSAFRRELERPVDSPVDFGETLEDKDYLDFVCTLKNRGYEIALHGITAGNSYRAEIIRGLEKYRAIFGEYPRMNVFHERNIENLYAGHHKVTLWPLKALEILTNRSEYLGHLEDSPYFWGDVAKQRIKYMRLPFHTISEVNTLKVNPSMPFYDPRQPYVNYWFTSSDGSDPRRFQRLLSINNIKNLERENGVCIIYTHFAKGFVTKKGDTCKLDPGFVSVVRNLSRYENGWFPTASELLDRLLACQMVSIKYMGHAVVIRNTAHSEIHQLSVKVNPDQELIDGQTNSSLTEVAPRNRTTV